MMRILICMMAAVAITILAVSGCVEVKERCHETGNQVTTFVMVGNVLLPITSNEITCE
ncbi:hypothetical protein Shfl1p08 [Shigella phage Shfl1]|uniref:Lipoprotein n=1 Tax=Shigella phage Shfl1 TaxID=2919551 RepID=F2VWW0_9CAUD|nr:hypothetical protein Shfl1p08 [Shigella phage Shfl1]AEA72888.1 hypothetical protein Shfl1p08 [Shigella phage Shfl1]